MLIAHAPCSLRCAAAPPRCAKYRHPPPHSQAPDLVHYLTIAGIGRKVRLGGGRCAASWEEREGAAIATGSVKWFNNAKGYGFILPDEGGEDLFAHYSAIQTEGYKALKAGQRVSFDAAPGAKGLQAVNIRTLAEGEP